MKYTTYTYDMPRPARLDRTAVLTAALAIADAEGLGAVSMHAVAARLGVTAMALYRHVGNKDALLDGLVERLLEEIEPPRTGPALDQLVAMGAALRRIARRHPAVFPLLLQRPAITPRARAIREQVYARLRAAGGRGRVEGRWVRGGR